MCLGDILWSVHGDIQSNLFKTITLGTCIKWSSWMSGILKMFFGEKFTNVAKTMFALMLNL